MCGGENDVCGGDSPTSAGVDVCVWFVCCGWLVPTVTLPPGGIPIRGWEFINQS
jgi:hypothetical protein